MNVASSISPVITADNESLKRDFLLKPFAIRHKLSGHPLLTLPRIAQLASSMPRDLIEYNSGDAAISQDPDKVKSVDLDPIWRGRLAIGDVLIPLNRRDPFVPAIRLGLALRTLVREPARRLVHFIRKFRETRS